MIIHYHHAIVPNSGYLKRMKNIDKDLVGLLGEKSVEVEFYSNSKREYVMTEGQFTLSPNVEKKYYVGVSSNGKLSNLKKAFTFMKLCLRYRPKYVIGEAQMLPKLLWVFRLFAPQAKLIFDVHGAVAEETAYQGAPEAHVQRVKTMERTSVERVDYIVCQSTEMKNFLLREYNVEADRICVYRCGVDTSLFKINGERDKVRKNLGVAEDEVLFVYSGGVDAWQRVGASVDMFNGYHQGNPKSKFLILTMEVEKAKEILRKKVLEGDNSYIVKSVPFAEVPGHLNASDVAFLLRDNHTMNAVASPTKLAEYLACGLPVITSEVAKYWVDEKGKDYCVFEEEWGNGRALAKGLKQERTEIAAYAKETLSLEVDKESLANFVMKVKIDEK